jgi:hypothetical protein
MAPTQIIPCKFFAQGLCRYGDSCEFNHERNTSVQSHVEPVASPRPAIKGIKINLADATHLNSEGSSTQICKFFTKGLCNKSDNCRYVHPRAILPPQQVYPDALSLDQCLGQQDKSYPQAPPDSRAKLKCKFFWRPSGCQNSSCPYSHAVDGHELQKSSNEDFDVNEDEASIYFSDLCGSQY